MVYFSLMLEKIEEHRAGKVILVDTGGYEILYQSSSLKNLAYLLRTSIYKKNLTFPVF